MSHNINDIITLITAMRDKALTLQHMQNDLHEDMHTNVVMRNIMDDIRAMARQIVYDDPSER